MAEPRTWAPKCLLRASKWSWYAQSAHTRDDVSQQRRPSSPGRWGISINLNHLSSNNSWDHPFLPDGLSFTPSPFLLKQTRLKVSPRSPHPMWERGWDPWRNSFCGTPFPGQLPMLQPIYFDKLLPFFSMRSQTRGWVQLDFFSNPAGQGRIPVHQLAVGFWGLDFPSRFHPAFCPMSIRSKSINAPKHSVDATLSWEVSGFRRQQQSNNQ